MTDGTPGAAPIEAALGALLPPGAVGVVWAAGEGPARDGRAAPGAVGGLEGGPAAADGPASADGPSLADRRAAADEPAAADRPTPVDRRPPAGRIEDELPLDELAAIRNAVPSRREEFARGRACAREALRRLGGVPEPIVIPVGPSRAPVWPAGVTGSITHCEGFVAAVVARVEAVAAIGVDAEPAKPLPPGVRDEVLTPAERGRQAPDDLMETVSFSAKEAIHKAIHPMTDAWLDFQDVELAFDGEGGGFRAAVVGAAAAGSRAFGRSLDVSGLVGRYAMLPRFLITVAYLPGRGATGPGA